MRTTTFSFIDHVPASVREFPKRRAAEIAGLVALAGVASLTLALLTWSVSDPSLNHATNARIHNLLGAPGAIAADLVMQFIGLASAALLAPPAFWGWSLLTRRRLERPRLKAGLYLSGVIAAAALASLLPAPGSWPLPTGLGGVVGDAVLALPRRLLPVSPWATIARRRRPCRDRHPRARRRLRRGRRSSSARDDAPDNAAGKARAQALARFDDEEDEDEPSFGMVSIGAVIHALLTAKATLRRMACRGSKTRAAALARPQPRASPATARPGRAPRRRRHLDRSPPPSRLALQARRRPFPGRRRVAPPSAGSPQPRCTRRRHAGPAARRMDHALDHDADRAEEIGRRQDFAGRAGAERAAARRRPRRFRRQGRDRQRAPRPGRRPLRTRAGARHQVVAGHRARRRHRPLDVGGLGPRGGGPGPQRHRHRIAEPAPRHRLSARASRQRRLRPIEPSPADRARQDDRRRAGDRRSRPACPTSWSPARPARASRWRSTP